MFRPSILLDPGGVWLLREILTISTNAGFLPSTVCRSKFLDTRSIEISHDLEGPIILTKVYHLNLELFIPVVPGQAGGGSFQKEKNYITQKEFAYRMCARRPTSAMPKSFLCCERAFCRSMVVMFCALKWSVLMSWCLLRGQVMWWSRHLMRCDGLCCVMSRDAMRCHGDELYYSRTTLCYKILIQILLCTTKYYSSTTKYYSSTTPVLTCTTKYYSSTNLYYKVLLCTTQYYSSTTLYYKVLLQY